MPKIKLTEATVAKAKHDGSDINNTTFYWDAALGNFALAVAASGRKTFIIQYRSHRVSRRMTVGRADRLAVDDARKLARKFLSKVDHGVDPLLERRKSDRASLSTFRAVAESYIAEKANGGRMRSVDRRRTVLERLVYPELGTWQIDDVRRVDLARVLRKIGQDNGPAAADHTLGIIRAVLNWHALNDENYRPPSLRELTLTPDEQKSRTRFLSHPEIRSLWKAKIAAPWGPFSKFLLLTACRRSEAAEATWGEIRDGTWIIPASRYKTKTEMRFPLSRAALDVLASLPRVHGSDFIFTTDGTRPLSAFTEGKQNIDKASRVVGWTFHDLRRTARTLLSEIRVDPDVAERCLGHKIAGIRGTYDIHKYESEMLHAFEALATQIERIANPQENVVVMGAGR